MFQLYSTVRTQLTVQVAAVERGSTYCSSYYFSYVVESTVVVLFWKSHLAVHIIPAHPCENQGRQPHCCWCYYCRASKTDSPSRPRQHLAVLAGILVLPRGVEGRSILIAGSHSDTRSSHRYRCYCLFLPCSISPNCIQL